jgi:uncharacterized integral membrane protein
VDDLEPRGGLQPSGDRSPERSGDERSHVLYLVAGAVLAGALLLFIVQNTQSVQLHWLTFTFETQQWVFVVIVAAVTIGLAKVGGYLYRRRKAKAKAGTDVTKTRR